MSDEKSGDFILGVSVGVVLVIIIGLIISLRINYSELKENVIGETWFQVGSNIYRCGKIEETED